MRNLYKKIYLTVIATLLLVVVLAGATWRIGYEHSPGAAAIEMAGELAAAALPAADLPRAAQEEALERFGGRLDADLTLLGPDMALIASAGRPIPPRFYDHDDGWWRARPTWRLPLPDGRLLIVRPRLPPRNPFVGLVVFLGVIALAVGICAYPVVRGLTRRLERLQAGVETLGAGDLSARVHVKGRDEVARLAASFNSAAARIEELVSAHRLLLANASHELRTPLSRIRLGIELFQQSNDPKYKAALERDIAELDHLIDEILLASRLDATKTVQTTEDVDLLALAAEEASHYDEACVGGDGVTVRGDPRLLRRLIRNLLENACRHGKPPIEIVLRRDGSRVVMDVTDGGDGIPEAERENVFTPFHKLGGSSEGAGLGLSLVRQIARLHGGDVIVAPDSTTSCFRVTLPIV